MTEKKVYTINSAHSSFANYTGQADVLHSQKIISLLRIFTFLKRLLLLQRGIHWYWKVHMKSRIGIVDSSLNYKFKINEAIKITQYSPLNLPEV